MKIVYKSNGNTVADGIRVARIADDGQKIEILTDPKDEQFSEVAMGVEVSEAAQASVSDPVAPMPDPETTGLTSYRLSDRIIAVEIPDGEIVVHPQVVVTPSDEVDVDRDPNDRTGGRGTLNGVEGNFSGDKNTAVPVTFRRWPELRNVNAAFDIGTNGVAEADDPAKWRVNGARPQKVWRRSVPTKTRRSAPNDFINERLHTVFIELANPLAEGQVANVKIPGAGTETVMLSSINPLIRTPTHYIEGGAHKAYMGQWLAIDSAGNDLTTDAFLSESTTWRLLDASGEVASGTLTLVTPKTFSHRRDENYNGADVYELDYTGLAVGAYRLEVEGFGMSTSFVVSNDWVEPFACDITRFITHQRSGVALNNLDGRDRPRNGHPNDGLVVHKSSVTLAGTSEGFVFPGEKREDSIKLLKAAYSPSDPLSPAAFGGIHDAGDWDRRIQHMDLVYAMGLILERFESARSVDVGIPEHGQPYSGTVADIGDGGDGATVLPDLLHEALNVASLWRRTIGPNGEVHGGVEYSNDGIVNSKSWNPVQRAFQYAPDPWSALLFVKGVAKLALVSPDPVLKQSLTDEALLAWSWARANLSAKYLGTPTVMRAYVAAAGVLFRLTGLSSAKQIFDRYNAFKPGGETDVRRGDARFESLDYALGEGADPEVAQAIIDWLDGQYDKFKRIAEDGSTISAQYPPGEGWKRFGPCTGWVAQHVSAQFMALDAPISGARDLIAQSLWFAMGANPSRYSMIAGWGNWMEDMVHKDLEDLPNVAGQSCYGISGVGLSQWEKPKIEGAMYPTDLEQWARYSRVIPSSAIVPCTEHGMKASHMELLFAAFALLEAK